MLILSHPISSLTPAYGGGDRPVLTPDKSIQNSDSCNTMHISMSNHIGTHVDSPYHFNNMGKKLGDFSVDYWFCQEVQLLKCDLDLKELCGPKQLSKALNEACEQKDKAEIVILSTGWSELRSEQCYWKEPPGFYPEAADWIRDNFPSVRFFGFDLISISSFAHREIGREAHKSFLCNKNPIMIVEDMDLRRARIKDTVNNVLISPIFLVDADGAPCTVWANI